MHWISIGTNIIDHEVYFFPFTVFCCWCTQLDFVTVLKLLGISEIFSHFLFHAYTETYPKA